MENDEMSQAGASHSVSTLIAWLSVCMLAAAWGSSLGPDWALSWMEWGAFGLVAAVGLNISERVRAMQRQNAEKRAALDRLESRLDLVMDDQQCTQAVWQRR